MILLLTLLILLVLLKLLFDLYSIELCRKWTKKIQLGTVEFYLKYDALKAGDSIQIFYHCPEPSRFCLYSALDRNAPIVEFELKPSIQSNVYSFWRGFEWKSTEISVPEKLYSGLYIATLKTENNKEFSQPVLINSPERCSIGVFFSTNTWCAYNDYGGYSNYVDRVSPFFLRYLKVIFRMLGIRIPVGERHIIPSSPLPFTRPNIKLDDEISIFDTDIGEIKSHLLRSEIELLKLLEKNQLSYKVYSDRDLAFTDALTNLKLAVFTAHSEYWSEEMIARLNAYLDSGGKAIFLSGNNWYRKVRFTSQGLMVTEQSTDAAAVANCLGTGYTAEGYLTYAPYKVLDASHPVFEGTGLENSAIFGGLVGGGDGASGYETDKINSGTRNTEILAVGLNDEGPAYLTWKRNRNDGWVCNFGSVSACSWVMRCQYMQRLVENAISIALKKNSQG